MTINQITDGTDRRTCPTKFLDVVDRAALTVLFGLVMLPMVALGLA